MQEILQTIVNAGIGAVLSVVETLQKTFNDLVSKGAAADDETSKKIKELIQNLSQDLEKVKGQVESNVQEVAEKLKELLPSSKYEELEKRLDELQKQLKK